MSKDGSIDLTPTWVHTMKILILALESGTPEGQRLAKSELFALANGLDVLQRRMSAVGAATVSVSALLESRERVTLDDRATIDSYAFAMTGLANGCALLRGSVFLGWRQTGDDTVWPDIETFSVDLRAMAHEANVTDLPQGMAECDDGYVRYYRLDDDDGLPTGPVVLEPVYGRCDEA